MVRFLCVELPFLFLFKIEVVMKDWFGVVVSTRNGFVRLDDVLVECWKVCILLLIASVEGCESVC